jgi:hypothetical protein
VKSGPMLTLSDSQSRPMMTYWPTMIINRWDEDKADFQFTFWGTGMLSVYGMELTGKYIKRGEFTETQDAFHKVHYDAMTDKRPVYFRTSIHWINKDYHEFNAVVLPMELRGSDKGTLAYVVFDKARGQP